MGNRADVKIKISMTKDKFDYYKSVLSKAASAYKLGDEPKKAAKCVELHKYFNRLSPTKKGTYNTYLDEDAIDTMFDASYFVNYVYNTVSELDSVPRCVALTSNTLRTFRNCAINFLDDLNDMTHTDNEEQVALYRKHIARILELISSIDKALGSDDDNENKILPTELTDVDVALLLNLASDTIDDLTDSLNLVVEENCSVDEPVDNKAISKKLACLLVAYDKLYAAYDTMQKAFMAVFDNLDNDARVSYLKYAKMLGKDVEE